MIYTPWPPPKPDWPPHVVAIYQAGCVRIDTLRVQMQPDGICPIPFQCYLCDKMKSDFSFLTGDGVPICVECCPVPKGDHSDVVV